MKTKAVSEIMLILLLLTSILTLEFSIQQVKSEPTTIIVPDDYEKIQWAIDHASDGDTIFVRAGTYYEHVTVDKSISLIGEDKCNTTIDGNYDGIVVTVTADNINITGFTIQKSGPHIVFGKDGIHIRSSGNNISYNIITDNRDGIYLYSSFNNTISGNNIVANFASGIYLQWNSSNNFISKNNITDSVGDGVFLEYGCQYNNISGNNISNCGDGIQLSDSSNYNRVFGNNVRGNSAVGISIYFSSNNSIYQNNITNNENGMYLFGYWTEPGVCRNNVISRNNIMANNGGGIEVVATYNSISGNKIANNGYGIYLDNPNNTIYHNNFINNGQQVYMEGPSYANFWDNGYPSGGNYWSDYTDVDLYSGPYQNVTGVDGIWDHPYIIDADNEDRYPLVEPWTPIPSDVNGDGVVDVSDLFDLSKAYGCKLGDDNWNPNCDFNDDEKIDDSDLSDLNKNYGKTV